MQHDSDMEPGPMMLEHPSHVPWVHPICMMLGVWLVGGALFLPYDSTALLVSDVLAGVAAVVVAAIALKERYAYVAYAQAAIGLWLLLAPLVFWTTSAAVYLQDTLVGALLIGFAVLVPMGMQMSGPDVPPGWSYNPSSWPQRAPLVALAFVSFFFARHMAAFQLGHTTTLMEPFFGEGTRRVLTSDVSRAWPISDAGLGAATYLIEALSGLMGDKRRWRTMPWMVAMFGVVVVPLGVVSIALVIMQPVVVGAWCTFCLVTAALMLIMIPLALDEVVAMIQFLVGERRRGVSLWHAFWFGGTPAGASATPRADRAPSWRPAAMIWGVRLPWALVASTAIGLALMAAPDVVGAGKPFSSSLQLTGALVVTTSVIAWAEVARATRVLNALAGAWLVLSVFLLQGGSDPLRVFVAVAGLALAALAVPRGPIVETYGTYDDAARAPRRLHAPRALARLAHGSGT